MSIHSTVIEKWGMSFVAHFCMEERDREKREIELDYYQIIIINYYKYHVNCSCINHIWTSPSVMIQPNPLPLLSKILITENHDSITESRKESHNQKNCNQNGSLCHAISRVSLKVTTFLENIFYRFRFIHSFIHSFKKRSKYPFVDGANW